VKNSKTSKEMNQMLSTIVVVFLWIRGPLLCAKCPLDLISLKMIFVSEILVGDLHNPIRPKLLVSS